MSSLPPILILDDEADDVFILKRLLTKAGVQNAVVSFEDPTAAVAYIDSENKKPSSLYLPCMIFTDLQMPRMNGIEFVRWVRTQPNLEKLPVIMITSSEDPKDREAAQAAGVTRFLPKYPTSGGLKTLAAEHRCHIAVG